jgi:hypothetical protein
VEGKRGRRTLEEILKSFDWVCITTARRIRFLWVKVRGRKSPEVVMIIIITCRSENRMMSASDGAIESSGEIRRLE